MEHGQAPPTDWELVNRARRGDSAAFHDLVDRYAEFLYGLAVVLIGNSADAEDVLQETFTGAFRGLRAFRRESSVKTWLTRILIRQTARHHRDRARRRVIRLSGREESSPRALSAPKRADLRMDFGQAVAALSGEHREVIVLRELHGMSYDEIAAVLKLPRGTVESRLFRARREMQELLKDYLESFR